ncbi:MAG: AmmeMemoRadiSam system protein A [Ignavibacteria bacterium]|nr:AmmeMemoRadiSam system protein A [Ignavibacteria bacterium]
MDLTPHEKKELLELARRTIESALHGIPKNVSPVLSPNLSKPSGAFVTLRDEGELRGCIGYVEPRVPLSTAIQEVSLKAAFEDPRFSPVTADELDRLDIEISVLSPLTTVDDYHDIVVGVHGLVVDAGYTRGLLLPHVATEFLWTREQFLDHTCAKAGLPPETWKEGSVKIYQFTTSTFSESDITNDEQ